MMKQIKVKNYLSGFTVIELLVVIVIIGLLITAITINYTSAKTRGNCLRIKEDFDAIAKAARLYQVSTGQWAPTIPENTNPYRPAFVPQYLNQWPSTSFWPNKSVYLWYNGDSNAIPDLTRRIMFRYEVKVGSSLTYKYFTHCVDDSRPGVNPLNCVSGTSYNNFPVLNMGGTCP